MKTIIKMFVGFLWGISVHQTAPIFNAMPSGWGLLARMATGVLCIAPIAVSVENDFDSVHNPILRGLLRYFSASGSFGVGVVIAYMIESFLADYRSRQNAER